VLIAGSKDCTIWMWLANTGHCVHVLTGHEGPVTCGLFTSDGKTIVSGTRVCHLYVLSLSLSLSISLSVGARERGLIV
jgi:WD40 repeat protein